MPNTCPCCSETLLRHARHNGVYWFCSHCWQEMPELPQPTLVAHPHKTAEFEALFRQVPVSQ
ncbi:MAG: hypothetical protein AAGF66_04480 [Cyanobacteria bacterium P01_H01_bin.119]